MDIVTPQGLPGPNRTQQKITVPTRTTKVPFVLFPHRMLVASMTPEGAPVANVTPEGAPMDNVTAEGAGMAKVTPEGAPVAKVTFEGATVAIRIPQESL